MSHNPYKPEKPEAQLIYEVTACLLENSVQPLGPICHYLSECFSALATELDQSLKKTTYRAEYVPLPVEKTFRLAQNHSGPHPRLKRDIWITYRFIQLRKAGIPIQSDNDDKKKTITQIINKELKEKFKFSLSPKGISSVAYHMMARHPFFEEIVNDLSGKSTDPPHPIVLYLEYLLRRLEPYYADRPIPPHHNFCIRGHLLSASNDQFFPEDVANYCEIMANHIFRVGHTPTVLYGYTVRVLKKLCAPAPPPYAKAFSTAAHKTVLKGLAQSDRDYAIAFDVFDLLANGCRFITRNPADPTKAAATNIVGEEYSLDAKTVGKIYKKYQDSMEGTYWFSMKTEPDDAWQVGTFLYLFKNKEKLNSSFPTPNDPHDAVLHQIFIAPDGSVNPQEVAQAELTQHLSRNKSGLLQETIKNLAADTTAIVYASLARIEERTATQKHITIDHLPKMTGEDMLYLSKISVRP